MNRNAGWLSWLRRNGLLGVVLGAFLVVPFVMGTGSLLSLVGAYPGPIERGPIVSLSSNVYQALPDEDSVTVTLLTEMSFYYPMEVTLKGEALPAEGVKVTFPVQVMQFDAELPVPEPGGSYTFYISDLKFLGMMDDTAPPALGSLSQARVFAADVQFRQNLPGVINFEDSGP